MDDNVEEEVDKEEIMNLIDGGTERDRNKNNGIKNLSLSE